MLGDGLKLQAKHGKGFDHEIVDGSGAHVATVTADARGWEEAVLMANAPLLYRMLALMLQEGETPTTVLNLLPAVLDGIELQVKDGGRQA